MRPMAVLVVFALFGFAVAGDVSAMTERRLTYRDAQVWSSAVRFLRVDRQYKVLEKDRETGYLLFEYKDGGRTHLASLELVPAVVDERHVVRARLRIDSMPSYVEVVLLEKFLRKLKTEYGEPPPARVVKANGKPAASGNNGSDESKAAGGTKEAEAEEDLEVEEEDLEDSVGEEDR